MPIAHLQRTYFEGLHSEITHHYTTGGADQRWSVAQQQKRLFEGNLVAGGPLDAPVDVAPNVQVSSGSQYHWQ